MSDMIKIRKLPGTWALRAAGAVIGETTEILELSEGSLPPVLYFPRGDIAMAFLDETEKSSHCPHKGDASYYSIVTKNGSLENVAWSYEAPVDGAVRIKECLAFYDHDLIKIEEI